MGMEKLLMIMERRSCKAPMATAARVPRRSQVRISKGGNPEKPTSFPVIR